jgi:hypothetical protein
MVSRPKRVSGHTGTETESSPLREAQAGIVHNGRKPDDATSREGRRPSGCKPLSVRKNVWGTPLF